MIIENLAYRRDDFYTTILLIFQLMDLIAATHIYKLIQFSYN